MYGDVGSDSESTGSSGLGANVNQRLMGNLGNFLSL